MRVFPQASVRAFCRAFLLLVHAAGRRMLASCSFHYVRQRHSLVRLNPKTGLISRNTPLTLINVGFPILYPHKCTDARRAKEYESWPRSDAVTGRGERGPPQLSVTRRDRAWSFSSAP